MTGMIGRAALCTVDTYRDVPQELFAAGEEVRTTEETASAEEKD
jgi:hypothetical protein